VFAAGMAVFFANLMRGIQLARGGLPRPDL
jgi:hypothetical protein